LNYFDRQQVKTQIKTSCSRRRFLQFGVGATAALFLPSAFAKQQSPVDFKSIDVLPERKLSLINLHTGEQLTATYWAEGEYQTSELKAINHILRDHRTGDVHRIDNELLDLLNILHRKMGGKQAFDVISGYRSPETNAALRQKSSGVAKKSFHMAGKAIDIRLPGCQLSELHKAALDCKIGGVGYYPESDFIHVDTGPVRRWG
jgi:uncharacterized protein YcbK (DUF882 family)